MNKSNNALVDLIVYSSLVAAAFVFTAPRSQGPAFVKNSESGYARIIQAETGQSVTA